MSRVSMAAVHENHRSGKDRVVTGRRRPQKAARAMPLLAVPTPNAPSSPSYAPYT